MKTHLANFPILRFGATCFYTLDFPIGKPRWWFWSIYCPIPSTYLSLVEPWFCSDIYPSSSWSDDSWEEILPQNQVYILTNHNQWYLNFTCTKDIWTAYWNADIWAPTSEHGPKAWGGMLKFAFLTSLQVRLMLLVWDSHFSNHPCKSVGEFPLPSWSGCDILTCLNSFPPNRTQHRVMGCSYWDVILGTSVKESWTEKGKQRKPPRVKERVILLWEQLGVIVLQT